MTSRLFIKQGEARNTDSLPVRLILCFDGTGDTADGSYSAAKGQKSGTKDSVRTIFDLIKPGPVTDVSGKTMYQYAQYFEGVATINATQGGYLVQAQALFDGATGQGYLDILRNGYKVCCQQLQHDGSGRHEIFIFGFSRGAFISRALASFLQHVGLIKAEYLDQEEGQDTRFRERFRELLDHYMNATSPSLLSKATSLPNAKKNDLPPFCIQSPRVRLIGAFDTVKTIIPLPVSNLLKERTVNIDFQMDAPGIVDHFRHALALNEARTLFNPDLWKLPSDSSDSSYLEAWFFGFHHDVGGGATVQGLALWPLQWILRAAMEYGLALDPAVEPYDILFKGADNIVDSPQEIALKMFDMMPYHSESTRKWGLKLNEPFWPLPPNPREYFQFLTKPPYLKFLKPKVFVHPSAYLAFDVSSSFRIQVYQWKHFRKFLEGRFQALQQGTVPWWEEQTVSSILKEAQAVGRFNLLVIGRPNTGKETMIAKVFGQPSGPPTDGGINSPVHISGNDNVCIYYSDGFGPGGSDGRAEVAEFLERNRNSANMEEKIHAVWYFNDCSNEEVAGSEKELFDMDFGDIPVLVVCQNQDKLRDHCKDLALGQENPLDRDLLDQDIIAPFTAAMDRIKGQLQLPKVGKYVQAHNHDDMPKTLLNDTACCVDDDSVNIAQIKAQRLEVKPKIALATEETVRAYIIWLKFRLSGTAHPFDRNEDAAGMSLSMRLLEPVLATFGMRFAGDDKLIKSRIGAPWAALDKCTSGLCDKSLPGDLILMCMLDAVIIMTYAMSHRENPKNWLGQALPVKPSDVEKACTWYTATTKTGQETCQEELHRHIKELLASDGSPHDKSVANVQMKIIEIVEIQSEKVHKGTIIGAVTGAVKEAVSGLENLAVSSLGGLSGKFRGW